MKLGRILAGAVAAAVVLLALPGVASAGQVKAGVAVEDASWHVGASAGQYASDGTFADAEFGDPHQHSTRRAPSYGIQSRLEARALVVQGPDGAKFALVKNDLYIPQDLLWRRTAQILESKGIGIGRSNLTMTITHDHSSPMYSSTSWGVWAFQDVFDFRFFEYLAQKMARAVERANASMVPVRVGASVTQYGLPQRNVPGPSIADDGTPAGYPRDFTDHDLIVVRFDRLDGRPLANFVSYSVHPEDLAGNDLISADYVGPLQRMSDRATGAVTIYTQSAVGSTEPEDFDWTPVHERAYFSHRQYAQSEFKARGIAAQIADTARDVERGTPEEPGRFVPFRSDFGDHDVAFLNRWFPGPASHPYPGVSSCRTDRALQGDPRFPLVGLPDCESAGGRLGQPPPLKDAGITTDTIQQFGIPVPENYSAPSYTGLEEDVSVHLQAFKIGDVLFTVCSCEQWADQSKNIKTRTDRTPGNEWIGYDWSAQCTKRGDGAWDCPNPGNTSQKLQPIPDNLYQKFRAQVTKDATGWDELANVPFAESEPTDPNDPHFWGNYTHDDVDTQPAEAAANAQHGFPLTVAIAMANDYNGYIATYREYQRGDHYRKALTAWGPHSSDYMATRLVNMGRYLRNLGGAGAIADPYPTLPGANDIVNEWVGGAAKVEADLTYNDQRTAVIGELAANGLAAYQASLPDDLKAEPVKQPDDVQRFGTAFFTWVGGSNFTDQPQVRVQRFADGRWTEYADQSGEIPVTLKFPPSSDIPAYRVQGARFEWTAHFETFVSWFDLMDRPRATPPGVYRFVVDGARQEGGAPKPYRIESRAFAVQPWTGIAVEDLGIDGGEVGFKAGPRRTIQVPKSGGGTLDARLAPIDYPDTYKSPAKFISPTRHFLRDPAAPNDPDRFEWFCEPEDTDPAPNACTFRPWLDVGDLERVVFTFVSSSGKVERVRGEKVGGRWVATRKLRSGEGAYVESGDACDEWGNYNGKPTAMVGNRAAVPDRPPEGFSCVPKLPAGSVPGASGSGGPSGSVGGGSNPLGLPSTSRCVDRRRFSFKLHQPPRRRIVAVNVYVNGKRKLHRRGKRITRVTLKKLPASTRTYRVRIVAITNLGDRIVSQRRYRGCRKGRVKTHTHRGRGR
ncbi:MAG TPA: neutral/alkaline non-lysosomal ceramidase N-terminal domain-containing protein [Thermoleophilaceae bacterium]|jgi:hypothetical protein